MNESALLRKVKHLRELMPGLTLADAKKIVDAGAYEGVAQHSPVAAYERDAAAREIAAEYRGYRQAVRDIQVLIASSSSPRGAS